MVELKVVGIGSAKHMPDFYMMVLEEPHSKRRIAMVIGSPEAQAIAITLEQITLPRPATHDLFRHVFIGFDIKLERVELSTEDQILYNATLILSREQECIALPSRASDAIAIALRMHAPIMIDENVLNAVEATVADGHGEMLSGSEESMSIDDLQKRLQHYVSVEAYEEAARIQKIIAEKTKKASNYTQSEENA